MLHIAMGSDGLGSGRESVWASSSSNANPPMICGYPQVLARASEDRVVAVVASLARTRFGATSLLAYSEFHNYYTSSIW